MEFGAVRQRDTAAVDLLNMREIYPMLIDKTMEKGQFTHWVKQQGRYKMTKQSQFFNFVNTYLFANDTIIDPAVTVHTASTDITVQVTLADGTSPFSVNNLVTIPGANRRQARVVAKTNDAGGDLIRLQLIGTGSLELANGQKLVVSGIVGASGGGYLEHSKHFPETRSGVTQIFPQTICELTDVVSGSYLEIEVPGGKNTFTLIDELNGQLKYDKMIGTHMLFGDSTGLQFNSQTPTHTDTAGRAIQTSKSVRSYIEDEGITIPGVTIGKSLFDDLARRFAKLGILGNFNVVGGVETQIQLTDYVYSLNGSATGSLVDAGARWNIPSNEEMVGASGFAINGMRFKFMQLSNFDDPNLINFTGSAGFQNFAFIIPNEMVQLQGGGTTDNFAIRYMEYPVRNTASVSSDGIYMTTRLGDLTDNPTGERIYKVNCVTNQGLEFLNPYHSVQLILQSSGS
jgi:hypothetical protein